MVAQIGVGLLVWALGAAPAAAPIDSPEPAAEETARAESIYRVNPTVDGAIIGVGGAGIIAAYLSKDRWIHPRCPCDPAEVNPIDRTVIGNHSALTNQVSDVTVALAWIAPVVLDALDVGIGRPLIEDMTVYAEALAVNGTLVTLAKYVYQRPLPVVYAGQAPELVGGPGGYRSFYSGHTSNVATALSVAASTYLSRHGPAAWPWLVVAAATASVAIERVLAGRHFYSDVLMGAAAGALVGTVVPAMHRRAPIALSFWPSGDGGGQMAIQAWF